MISVLKIATTVVAMVFVIAFMTTSEYRHDAPTQIIVLALILLANIARSGWQQTLFFAKVFLIWPMLISAGVTAVLVFQFRYPLEEFWRPAWFAASMLWVKFSLSWISFRDTVNLPLPERWRHDMVLFQALVIRGTELVKRLLWYADRLIGPSARLTERLKSRLAALLASFFWLLGQAPLLNLVIRNRMHIWEETKL